MCQDLCQGLGYRAVQLCGVYVSLVRVNALNDKCTWNYKLWWVPWKKGQMLQYRISQVGRHGMGQESREKEPLSRDFRIQLNASETLKFGISFSHRKCPRFNHLWPTKWQFHTIQLNRSSVREFGTGREGMDGVIIFISLGRNDCQVGGKCGKGKKNCTPHQYCGIWVAYLMLIICFWF